MHGGLVRTLQSDSYHACFILKCAVLCYYALKYFYMSTRKVTSLSQTVFIAGALSVVMGTMVSLASYGPADLTEGYEAPSIPSRSALQSSLPNPPAIPTPDTATLRQAGNTQLQQFNPDSATDHNAMRSLIGGLSAESAQPDSNTPSDPLGNNAATGQNAQSSVSSTGALPAGTLSSEPRASAIGRSAVNRYGSDALASWYNYLAATMVLRAEIVTKQTQVLADKFDEINTIHKGINESFQELNSSANAILRLLPTNPGR